MKSESRTYNGLKPPKGEVVKFVDGKPQVPANPIIPFIEGDGIGEEIWQATRSVVDAAVAAAYGGKRSISWFEVFAGGKAKDTFDDWLPQDTLDAIAHYGVAIKGPLNTPSGGGFRSLGGGSALVPLRHSPPYVGCRGMYTVLARRDRKLAPQKIRNS